jgi:hypothetical protein
MISNVTCYRQKPIEVCLCYTCGYVLSERRGSHMELTCGFGVMIAFDA